MTKLDKFLEKKPLFYAKIDYERMPKVWDRIKDSFKLAKIIHIVGTNGKGSTGRFLAHHLKKQGLRVGHYSSPHILKFNERIWLDGLDVSDEALEDAHINLQDILSKPQSDSLSFFEYTTLLAMWIFQDCEVVVLEAGLGGEYDATAVFDNVLTLATTIDLDHESFLGDSIKEIAITKLNATKKALILGYQKSDEVLKIAKQICAKKDAKLLEYSQFTGVSEVIKELNLPLVFSKNLNLALSGVAFLGFEIEIDHIKDIKLFGRAEKISKNVTIDVGHNPLAASSLLEHFKGKKINLIFNTFADKDYEKTLSILKPIIKEVQIIKIENKRAEDTKELLSILSKLDIKSVNYKEIESDKEYLVFGSFLVVESFLNSLQR